MIYFSVKVLVSFDVYVIYEIDRRKKVVTNSLIQFYRILCTTGTCIEDKALHVYVINIGALKHFYEIDLL